jgi:hypothetical protein
MYVGVNSITFILRMLILHIFNCTKLVPNRYQVVSNLQLSADVMITKCFILVFTVNNKETGKLILIHTSVINLLKNEDS